jgi:hypothetical protein
MATRPGHSIRASRAARAAVSLPDGIGGTIAGGAIQTIDLADILSPRDRALSGAAGVAGPGAGGAPGQDAGSVPGFGAARVVAQTRPHAVSLSDGSRILFASIGREALEDA